MSLDLRLTPEQLSAYNGFTKGKIYLSVRGVLFDVTEGSDFYGPGCAYHVLAGTECSRSLALMSLKAEDVGRDDLADLTARQRQVLEDWEKRFSKKYPIVGRIQK